MYGTTCLLCVFLYDDFTKTERLPWLEHVLFVRTNMLMHKLWGLSTDHAPDVIVSVAQQR